MIRSPGTIFFIDQSREFKTDLEFRRRSVTLMVVIGNNDRPGHFRLLAPPLPKQRPGSREKPSSRISRMSLVALETLGTMRLDTPVLE